MSVSTHLHGGSSATILYVVEDGVVEEHGVLRHDADEVAHALLRELLDVTAVDEHGALHGVVEAEQQTRDCGLAGTWHSWIHTGTYIYIYI